MSRTAVVVLLGLLGCDAGHRVDETIHLEQSALSPLALPGTPGNGANVRVTCSAQAADGSCQSTQILSIAQAVAALNGIAAPPALPFTSPRVYSFNIAAPVDWSDGNVRTS